SCASVSSADFSKLSNIAGPPLLEAELDGGGVAVVVGKCERRSPFCPRPVFCASRRHRPLHCSITPTQSLSHRYTFVKLGVVAAVRAPIPHRAKRGSNRGRCGGFSLAPNQDGKNPGGFPSKHHFIV